ncbi:MAG TPA: choice-of-anchor tandem repeat GloVer-containing protein [Terriglobia bacterium]|nr:choice-of-anchor tandem repeat GloVer-containing protein [Terriglobia bacterium]
MTSTREARVSGLDFRTTAIALAALVVLGLGLVGTPSAKAQAFTTPYSFCSLSNCTDGAYPYAGLAQGRDGNFYGTTGGKGAYGAGTVFKITSEGALTTLYAFCALSGCTDGGIPQGGLVQGTDGNFYGTTSRGGLAPPWEALDGTVFKITPEGALTTLYSFCSLSNCTDGALPSAGLAQGTDGNFYGTTFYGGYYGGGMVFKITPGGALTTLYSFCSLSDCTDGADPSGTLVLSSDGSFYGTTTYAGANGAGTVFKITPSGILTTLHSFCSQSDCADGEYPFYPTLVQASDGDIYGTTLSGGGLTGPYGNGGGTVFKITPTGALTTLYSFCKLSGCADGYLPYAGVVQGSDGNLYGAMSRGGAHAPAAFADSGTLFRISPSGTLTTLYSFCFLTGCTDGAGPVAALAQGSDGNFYGTTESGGANGYGTVFRLPLGLIPGVSPISLAFGSWADGATSGAGEVTVTNTGTTAMTFLGASFTGANAGDFAQTDNCPASLTPGASCNIHVTFTPSILGAETATLNISDSAASSPQTVALSGTGSAPVLVFPSSQNFGSVAIYTPSETATITLTNVQSVALNISSITLSNPDFSQTNTCGSSLAPHALCTISVTLTPSFFRTETATLTVNDSASNSPQTVALSGFGE